MEEAPDAAGERSPDRLAQRKACRDRDWETRAGTVELRIPKLPKGSYFVSFLESWLHRFTQNRASCTFLNAGLISIGQAPRP